jgi:hypothetical protein
MRGCVCTHGLNGFADKHTKTHTHTLHTYTHTHKSIVKPNRIPHVVEGLAAPAPLPPDRQNGTHTHTHSGPPTHPPIHPHKYIHTPHTHRSPQPTQIHPSPPPSHLVEGLVALPPLLLRRFLRRLPGFEACLQPPLALLHLFWCGCVVCVVCGVCVCVYERERKGSAQQSYASTRARGREPPHE